MDERARLLRRRRQPAVEHQPIAMYDVRAKLALEEDRGGERATGELPATGGEAHAATRSFSSNGIVLFVESTHSASRARTDLQRSLRACMQPATITATTSQRIAESIARSQIFGGLEDLDDEVAADVEQARLVAR